MAVRTNQARRQTAPPVPGEFGPNDFHFKNGQLNPGLGPDHRPRTAVLDEPPAKAELRATAAALQDVEKSLTAKQAELEAREAVLAEREAQVAFKEKKTK